MHIYFKDQETDNRELMSKKNESLLKVRLKLTCAHSSF